MKNQQQLFSNFGNQLGFLTPFLSQLFGAGQAGGGQAAQISIQIGQQQFQNAIGQQRQSGQAFGGALNTLNEGLQPAPIPFQQQQPQQLLPPGNNSDFI